MPSSPQVSIVIPCYKGARYLGEAIESCLAQTFSDFELIIVDDASPDECGEIACAFAQRDSRIRVLRHEQNAGVSEAFNTGFAAARGVYFTRLAQDDLFAPEAIDGFVNYFEANPQIGLVYCNYAHIDESGERLGDIVVPGPERALLVSNRIGLCVAWRRNVWEKVGRFNKRFDTSEDYEYWLRVWNCFEIGCRSGCGPMLLMRQHSEMGSYRFADRQERTTLDILRTAYPQRLPALHRFTGRRKAFGRAYFSAAADYWKQGHRFRALNRMVRSMASWPLPFCAHELPPGRSRIQLIAAMLIPASARKALRGNAS